MRWLNRAPLLCRSGGQCCRSHTHSTHFNLTPPSTLQLSKSAGITHCMVHTIRNCSNSNDVSTDKIIMSHKIFQDCNIPPPPPHSLLVTKQIREWTCEEYNYDMHSVMSPEVGKLRADITPLQTEPDANLLPLLQQS